MKNKTVFIVLSFLTLTLTIVSTIVFVKANTVEDIIVYSESFSLNDYQETFDKIAGKTNSTVDDIFVVRNLEIQAIENNITYLNALINLDNSSYFLTITKMQNEHYKIQLKFNGESIDSNNQVRIVTYFDQIKYIKKVTAITKYNCSLSIDVINIIPNIEHSQYIFLNNDYEDLSNEVSGSFYIIITEHYDTNTNTYFQNAQYYKEK